MWLNNQWSVSARTADPSRPVRCRQLDTLTTNSQIDGHALEPVFAADPGSNSQRRIDIRADASSG